MEKQSSAEQPTAPDQRKVYLMIRDTGDGTGIEWGVDWGLAEGEELPADVEELTRAQYTAWQVVKALKGIGDDEFRAETKRQATEKPSGILVPKGGKIVPA